MNIYEVHKSNPDIFNQLTLKDQLFLYYKCPQKDKILQLYSNHNQINFTIRGKRLIHHGNNTWETNKDKGFFVKRCAFLQELPSDYSDWEVLVLYLKDNYLKKVLEEFRQDLPVNNLPKVSSEMFHVFKINTQIRNCYESLLPYFEKPQLLPDTIFEGKFKELLYNILAHPDNKHILAYVNQLTGDYLIPIWEVMEANYMYNLKISEFAEIANRSTSTFRRDFEEYYKTTPGKWLTMKRLEKASLLLISSEKSIGDITFNCGFENVSHFSRIFKDTFNVSPSEYRNQNK
ncbi:helix-turn-helix domain-containing protein [Cyclobacterium jeungdonense]|uniref:AraC family transcriptional regulator n=1 Tax=Cyclobacterium jeungdonense TaxID=708087 RepID=A0ABT8CBF8_9BACT|nr:AraC family transcriptional regulator [Cyclobacterium jeungdonense]MDN3689085.1 AraC family transcriptional regulator [Cyclobacterium jeungdonense]